MRKINVKAAHDGKALQRKKKTKTSLSHDESMMYFSKKYQENTQNRLATWYQEHISSVMIQVFGICMYLFQKEEEEEEEEPTEKINNAFLCF